MVDEILANYYMFLFENEYMSDEYHSKYIPENDYFSFKSEISELDFPEEIGNIIIKIEKDLY